MDILPENIQRSVRRLAQLGKTTVILAGDNLPPESHSDLAGVWLVLSGTLIATDVDHELQAYRSLYPIGVGQLAWGVTAGSEFSSRVYCGLTPVRACYLGHDLCEQLSAGSHASSGDFNCLLKFSLQQQSQHYGRLESELRSPVVDAMVQRSMVAQKRLLSISEDQIDAMISDIADTVNRQAWELAQAAIKETGMGVLNHRVQKILLGTMEVAATLIGKPGSGSLQIESPTVDSVTVPMGVVLGLIPVTNPVETLVFKTLIALKSRNAIILSSHRRARLVSGTVVTLIRDVLHRYQVDPNLVQIPELPARRTLTNLLMSHPNIDFILATGGPSMVRSAYQSGTPSSGVGKGNAPVWVCHDSDPELTATQIVDSKSFDNGIVCGSENNLIVDGAIEQALIEALVAQGAAVLTAQETQGLTNALFSSGELDPAWMGKSAQQIGQHVGIHRSYPIRLLVVPVTVFDAASPLLREKLAPIVSLLIAHSEGEALNFARGVLAIEGRGHTAIIHTSDSAKIERFSAACDVCRVLVNTPGTQGCIGACNGLELSWTLGCGTAGGSSTSDNVTYRHLQNTKRIAHARPLMAKVQKLA